MQIRITREILTLKEELTHFRVLIHIVICSNYFDLNKTVTGGQRRKN